MNKALYALPVLLLTVACASVAGTKTDPGTSDSTSTATPDGREQRQRTLACGTTIAPPLSQSMPGDERQFTITAATVDEHHGTVAYRITDSDPKARLPIPDGEVAPRALLLKDGRIVAMTDPADPANARPALAAIHPVGEKPYEDRFTVDLACPGTSFAQVKAHPEQYRAVVVMSMQSQAEKKDGVVPLFQAVATPTTS